MQFSACIEMLFAEEPDFARRIDLAAAAGLPAVEFWRWTNKDLDAVEAALKRTGLALGGIVAEPMIGLNDPVNHEAFLAGLAQSRDTALRLGTGVLITQAGNERPGVSRQAQREAIVAVLKRAADVLAGSGVAIALEPLNILVDHPGYFLASTAEGLDIVDAVGRPEIGLTYDLYHSAVMGEETEAVLAGRVDRVLHVHVADHPGRNDPGSGEIDLAKRLAWLFAQGYAGWVGLEYQPLGETAPGLRAALSHLE